MNKGLIKLAMNLLDRQDGIEVETYDALKTALKEDGSGLGNDIIRNITVVRGRAFVDEEWVEANADRIEV